MNWFNKQNKGNNMSPLTNSNRKPSKFEAWYICASIASPGMNLTTGHWPTYTCTVFIYLVHLLHANLYYSLHLLTIHRFFLNLFPHLWPEGTGVMQTSAPCVRSILLIITTIQLGFLLWVNRGLKHRILMIIQHLQGFHSLWYWLQFH